MAEDIKIPVPEIPNTLRDMMGYEQGNPLPPATWVDVIDSDKANEWLDKKVKPIQEVVDNAYAVVIKGFELVLGALEAVETLLVGIEDPISMILQEIIDMVEAILKDLRNAGFYVTWDSAWTKPGPLKASNFAHGYTRVKQELVKKLTDESDKSRPDFTRLSSVFSITAYGGGGATNILPLIKICKKFLALFGVTSASSYSPPILDTPGYTKSFPGLDDVDIPWPLELIEEDTEIGGIQVKWSNPPSKKLNFFDVDLPPACYLITVTTRPNPLPLFVEMKDPNSTANSGGVTVIKPMRMTHTSVVQATTLVAPRVDSSLFVTSAEAITDSKPFLFARVDGKKISYDKFKNETKTFMFQTHEMGAVIGGSEYTFSLRFEKLPQKKYDVLQGEETDDFENYFIYMSSHGTEDKILKDGDEITEDIASNKDRDYGYIYSHSKTLDDTFLFAPLFSQPQRIKRNPKEKFKYITALKEALVRFIFVEEYFSQVESKILIEEDSLFKDEIPQTNKENIYSIFGVGGNKELYKQYKGDRWEVSEFRDEIEDMVRDALATILGRGLPSKTVLKSLEEDIDTILDTHNDTSPLLYPLLDQDFDYDLPDSDEDITADNMNQGIFPNAHVGLEDRAEEATVQGFLKDKSYPNVKEAGYEKEQTFIYNYKKSSPEYLPFKLYLSNDKEKAKWKSSIKLLTGLPNEPSRVGVGEWAFLRILPDGLPALETFLEEILAFIKALKKGFEGIIAAILRYINLLRERINSIRRFVDMIKRIIDMILSIRLPGGLSYLMTESDGTDGFIEALGSAENQPPSGETVYGTYACFVFGGLPSILVDLLLSMIESNTSQNTKDKITAIFTGNEEGETDNQIFFSPGEDGGGETE